MDPSLDQPRHGRRGGWQIAIWLGLLAAFSPVLLDLSAHFHENAWTRASLIFPWLLWMASRRVESHSNERDPEYPFRLLWLCLFLGLAIELIAVAGGSLRFGRIGLVVAAFGVCRAFYSVPLGVAVVLVWALPLPTTLINIGSPGLETFWGRAAAAIVPGLTLESLDRFPFLATSRAQLKLLATDGGITIAYYLAGLGWYRAVSSGRGLKETIVGSLRLAVLAIPVQFLFVVGAGLLLRLTQTPAWPRLFLAEFSWIFVLVVGFALGQGGRWRTPRIQTLASAP